MGGIVDSIFGGGDDSSDDSSAQAQLASNRETNALIARLSAEARADAERLFPQAQAARLFGTGAALGVFGQSIPQQLQAIQQGNVGAQQTNIQGLNQFQNAILGNPIDLSQFQPQQITLDQLPGQFSLNDLSTGAPFELLGQGAPLELLEQVFPQPILPQPAEPQPGNIGTGIGRGPFGRRR